MITAAQAKQITLDKLQQTAKEFIINSVDRAINESARTGKFVAIVNFEGVPNPETTGELVVKLLEEKEFEAEHVYYDGPNGHDNYIIVKWGED